MISIVIPVYNRKEYTRNCLLSLEKQTFKDFEVIVVDDGSTDGTEEMLRTEFSHVTTLIGDGNLFWTASVNMGIRHALKTGASYVMTLNNDTVLSEDFLEKMHAWSVKEPNAIIGALELDYVSKKPVFAGKRWEGKRLVNLLDTLEEHEMKGLHAVAHLPGRGLLIPRSVTDRIGIFDEKNFPHYWADFDYTKVALKNGVKLYCNHDAKLYTFPEESGDAQNKARKNIKNFYNHLFHIRGGGNLKDYTRFAKKHEKRKLPLLKSLIVGYSRRILGYWVK